MNGRHAKILLVVFDAELRPLLDEALTKRDFQVESTATMAAALDGIHLYAFAIGPEAEAGLALANATLQRLRGGTVHRAATQLFVGVKIHDILRRRV